jgi:hypothetical protein
VRAKDVNLSAHAGMKLKDHNEVRGLVSHTEDGKATILPCSARVYLGGTTYSGGLQFWVAYTV